MPAFSWHRCKCARPGWGSSLQAVFETSLNRFLDDFIEGESRCALDPGCRNGGGACMACLHLGEPSCRWFNRFLDRAYLFGPAGFVRGSD